MEKQFNIIDAYYLFMAVSGMDSAVPLTGITGAAAYSTGNV